MQTYLGRLVTNIWHATIWQPTSVLSPSAPKLLFSIAFCFRGLRLSNLHLHWGAVPVPVLQLFFAVLAARCSGDDSKFSCPFPILSSSVAGFRAGLGFGVAAVAVVAVGGRKRSFALDAAQHDQVDEAAIPALFGQVTARRGMRRDYQLLAPWCPHPAPAPPRCCAPWCSCTFSDSWWPSVWVHWDTSRHHQMLSSFSSRGK